MRRKERQLKLPIGMRPSRFEKLCLWIAAFAGLLTICMILRGCYREYFPSDEDRRKIAAENWPKLEIANSVICDTFFTEWYYPVINGTVKNEVYYNLTVKLNCQIINRGDVTANLFGILCSDTLSDDDILRRLVLDKEYRDAHVGKIDSADFRSYALIIMPGDSLKINPKIKVNYAKNEFSQIHLMLLYQNDQKFYFDTYCWIELQTRPLVYVKHNSYYVADLKDYAKIKRGGQDQKCYYKKDEIKKITEFCREMQEQLKK